MLHASSQARPRRLLDALDEIVCTLRGRIEAGEKRRFVLDAQCNRFKRQYQACLLELDAGETAQIACAKQLSRLNECVDGVGAGRVPR